ncbi:hypothetical protein GCM10017161_20850 [Thalassotalea marina]|uniref:Beta-lactamase-related domain-containing protein n=2 Tax=Thalassotalea marina TaxID=1673741 RepID=A0A919BK14_9GAMM|nr:hypothetical protein GCM10017161_20850 [Thalassotalea marina]
MIGKPNLIQPQNQPQQSLVFNSRYEKTADEAIQALLSHNIAVSSPGYTAAVSINGEKVWAGSVGWANIEKQIAMTPTTQLRVGSTSKLLTSVGLAKLIKQGKLNLDTPIKTYLKDLPNIKWDKITPRQLASHTAGLPHYGQNTEFFGKLTTLKADEHFTNVQDALTLFDDSELLFEPGEKFEYSSLGTVLLSAVMQEAANKNYQIYMQENVLEPLGLKSTTFEAPHNQPKQLASFYWRDEKAPELYKTWMSVDLSHRLAAGGWVSTSQDLVKLGQAFLNDDFIPAKVRDEFWTVQRLNSGIENHQGYGIGWRIHELDLGQGFEKQLYMHHGGVSAGSQSFLMVLPKYHMSIAINANFKTQNFRDFNKVSYELARLFIRALESE